MSDTIAIRIELFHVWIAAKLASACVLSYLEMKSQNMSIERLIRRFVLHALLNPEWAITKGLVFIPVWLLTGTKFIHKFLPIKSHQAPMPGNACRACRGTGKVLTMVKNRPRKVLCSCQVVNYWAKVSKTGTL